MIAKYEIGQRFILNRDFTFRDDTNEIIDVSKGNGFWINDALDHCSGDCDNCIESKCTISFMVLFDGFDASIEARLTESEIDELIE